MNGENRVALVPDVASRLKKGGFEVLIEKNAGLSAGFTDEQYLKAGALIVDTAEEVYSKGDVILKVQLPVLNEKTNKHEKDIK